MNITKKTIARAKNFVSDHKVVITATVTAVATATACLAVHRSAVKDWNEFLTEEGLLEKFYTHLDPNN